MPRESYIEGQAVRRAKAAGWLVRKMNTVKGDPDRLFVKGGKLVVIEFKQPGKTTTPVQEKRLEEWRAAGATTGVATTTDEAMEILNVT